jgi:hypothetical protein
LIQKHRFFFAEFFGENILKITTLVPGHIHRVKAPTCRNGPRPELLAGSAGGRTGGARAEAQPLLAKDLDRLVPISRISVSTEKTFSDNIFI